MNSLLNFVEQLQITSFLLGFILNMTIKGSIILCAAFAVNLIWKRASAAARHFIWSTAFAGILLIPFLSFTLPSWNISLFESQQQAIESPQKGFALPEFEEQGLLFRNSQLEEDLEQSGSSIANNIGSTDSEPSWSKISEIIGSASSVLKKLLESFNWSWLIIIWTMGSLYILSLFVTRLIRSWLLVKHAEPLQNNTFNRIIADCFNRFGVSKTVKLLKSESITVPLMWDYFNPSIVLPKEAEKWPEKRMEIVLLHEAAHIKRADFLSTIIAHAASVVYWYNPLIWIALRRFHFERENACDDYVLSSGTKPSVYARNLFEIAQALKSIKWASHLGLAIVRKNRLEGRVMEILNSTKQRSVLKPVTMLLVGLLAVSLLIPVSSIQTRAQKESTLVPSEAYKKYQGMVLRQVWAGPEADYFGAPSPDGRYLSYVNWDTGDLAIYEIATGKKRRLTNKGSWDESDEEAGSSIWSPDGKKIAYEWCYTEDHPMELRIIGIDGSKPRILYIDEENEWAEPLDWTPDGREILCITVKDGKEKIFLVSAADGSVRVIKTLENFFPHIPHNMSFSPDGRYIVYDSSQKEDSPDHDIYLMSTDGSRKIPLVEHPANEYVLGWAPDGKNILFASDRTGTMGLWLIAVADGKPQGVPDLVKPDIGRFVPLGFTQKGSFYYGISKLRDDIYIAELDPETGKILIPPKKLITRSEGSNIASGYSPDGKYLAYIYRSGILSRYRSDNILCIRSLETGKEREFSLNITNILSYSSPRWSPDCRYILIKSRENKNRWGIFQIDVQTGDVKPLVRSENGVSINSLEWSRDGKAIIYLCHNSKAKTHQIIVRDLETGKEKELYLSPGHEYEPFNISLSPDGQWLALRCINPTSLKVMPVTGGEPRELPEFEKVASIHKPIAWTADGKYIIFSGEEPGVGKHPLYRISAESGKIDRLGLEMTRYHSLSVHPDGKHISFSAWGSTPINNEIWVMENFLPEIKK